jgi:Domain of unknown function (DUF4184)
MPFTLAHPAAVLPLRGLRYLRTAPLILGAMIPDVPYYVPGSHRLTPDTHSAVGAFTTDLLLGYAALVTVFVLRAPLTALLPARARWLCLNALAPFTRGREWAFAPLAILVGVWTHLLWDSFTHSDGWMVHRVAALSAPVTIGPYSGQLCHVLQYVSSAFGLIVMAVWYARLRTPRPSAAAPGAARSPVGPVLVLVVVAATLIGSVQAVEHFNRWHSFYLTIDILLTRSLAWFAVLYLVAGTIVTLEQAHERVSGRDV